MAELQLLAQARGRPPLPVTRVCRNLDPLELEQFARAGVARVLVDLPSTSLAEIRPFLQTYARTVRSLTTAT